jgi:hypothetical protein
LKAVLRTRAAPRKTLVKRSKLKRLRKRTAKKGTALGGGVDDAGVDVDVADETTNANISLDRMSDRNVQSVK